MTDIDRLRRFVATAEELLATRYVAHVLERKGTNLKIDFKVGELTTKLNTPDKEASKAMILTARMFVQERDQISLDKVDSIAKGGSLSKEWTSLVTAICKKFNEYLDANALAKVDNVTVTRRDILETFLYGHYAHLNADKEELYQKWAKTPLLFQMYEFEFHSTLTAVFTTVAKISRLSKMELEGEVPSL